MALLKRIPGSTLMETLVATVLIVVVFTMASLLLNNWMGTSLGRRTQKVETRVLELQYTFENGSLELPYSEQRDDWTYRVSEKRQGRIRMIAFSATDERTGKQIERNRAAK